MIFLVLLLRFCCFSLCSSRSQSLTVERAYCGETWLLGEFEGRWATRRQGGEWGTMCGMAPGLGSVSGCPHSPAATSARCVWTQVHAGVIGISCDQPVHDRCVVFDFVVRWKEDFMSKVNRNFRSALMMGVCSCVCSGVFWGRGGL